MDHFQFLQERAYGYLREQILSDALSYDEVYSETRFAQEIGCSRTPVKDALTRLSHAKYIDILPSKGFRLHKLTEADIRSTFQTRVAIESFCAISLMQKRDTPSGRDAVGTLSQLLLRQKACADANEPDEFLKLDLEFHNEIMHFVPNSDFSELYEAHSYRIEKLAKKCLREEAGRCRDAYLEHAEILTAISSGGVPDCYAAVVRHNERTYQNDLQVLRRETPNA